MTKPLHVAIVSEYTRPWPGGISEHVFHEARELEARGHKVTLISGSNTLPWAVEFDGNGARSRLSVGPRVIALRHQLRALRADVVHVHAPLEPLLPLAAVLASPVPTVGTFHASHPHTLAWRALYRGPWGRVAFSRLAARICVSRESERTMSAFFPKAQFERVPNGVDTTFFRPREADAPTLDRNAPTVLFVGRPDPRKGLADALTAYAEVKRELPRSQMLLVGVTAADIAHVGAGQTHGVEALGYVAPEAIADVYRRAHVLCAPSKGGESQGIVLLEAMASGVVPVAYRIAGYDETVRDGESGVLVTLHDTGSLAKAMIRLLSKPEERAVFAQHARTRALSYDWIRVGARIELVLERAVAAKV